VGPCTLPSEVRAYKRTGEFNPDTVPQGLLEHHRTRAKVWGLAHVLSGELAYTVHPQDGEIEREYIVREGEAAVIRPQNYHQVRLLTAQTRFYVEFFRAPTP
jgi:tellurite methyltransferase